MYSNPAWMHWSRVSEGKITRPSLPSNPVEMPLVHETLPPLPGPVPQIPPAPPPRIEPLPAAVKPAKSPTVDQLPTSLSTPIPVEVKALIEEQLAHPTSMDGLPNPSVPVEPSGQAAPHLTPVSLPTSAPTPLISVVGMPTQPVSALPTEVVLPVITPDGGVALLKQAALKLNAYLRSPGARFGVKGAPSEAVAAFETVAGLPASGILGLNDRAAATRVGVTLPGRGPVEPSRKLSPPSLVALAPASDNATLQAKAAQAQKIATTQAAMGVTPTGVVDANTLRQAAALDTTLPDAPSGLMNPFGTHDCSAALPPKFDPISTALQTFGSARPDYSFAQHQATCRSGLLSVLSSGGRGAWDTARLSADKTKWTALGPLNLSQATAAWLYSGRGVLKPFDVNIKALKGSPGTAAYAASLKDSVTSPVSGAWWYTLALARLQDMLRPLLDLKGFNQSGLLTVRPDAPPTNANTAQNLAAGVNGIIQANPSQDPVAVLLRLFLKASSLKGMADAAVSANGVLP